MNHSILAEQANSQFCICRSAGREGRMQVESWVYRSDRSKRKPPGRDKDSRVLGADNERGRMALGQPDPRCIACLRMQIAAIGGRWEMSMQVGCKYSQGSWMTSRYRKANQVVCTSLLPRPNPVMTGPDSLIGKGASGPESGPATGSRGPSGRILSQ